jgi:hypothetical protein
VLRREVAGSAMAPKSTSAKEAKNDQETGPMAVDRDRNARVRILRRNVGPRITLVPSRLGEIDRVPGLYFLEKTG